MSDSHGHSDHGHEKKGNGDRSFMVDRFFERIVDYISGRIAKLIALMFIIMTVGALIGYFIAIKQAPFIFIFLPATLGIIAYYERDVAIVLFVALLLFVLL